MIRKATVPDGTFWNRAIRPDAKVIKDLTVSTLVLRTSKPILVFIYWASCPLRSGFITRPRSMFDQVFTSGGQNPYFQVRDERREAFAMEERSMVEWTGTVKILLEPTSALVTDVRARSPPGRGPMNTSGNVTTFFRRVGGMPQVIGPNSAGFNAKGRKAI